MLLEVRRYSLGRGHWSYRADVSGVHLEWRDEAGRTTLLEIGLAWSEARELAQILADLTHVAAPPEHGAVRTNLGTVRQIDGEPPR